MKSGKFCLVFGVVLAALCGNEDTRGLRSSFQSPLYVSLGGDCLGAGMIRHFGLRQAAFPFDWVVTADDEKMIEILNRNFQDFFNENYFIKHPVNGCQLVHSYYHMEFSHDWDTSYWDDPVRFRDGVEKIETKYRRRIARFQKLAEFPGRVIFIRVLYPRSKYIDIYPGVFWFTGSEEKSEHDAAVRLDRALKQFFPNLDYQLILVCKSSDSDRIEMVGNVAVFYFTDVEKHQSWELIFSK